MGPRSPSHVWQHASLQVRRGLKQSKRFGKKIKMSLLKTCRNIKETTSCLFLHRYHQQYAYSPACAYVPTPPHLSALPGHDYNQPLLPRNPESALTSGPPPYFGPPQSPCQPVSPGLVQIAASGPGLVWQFGGQQSGLNPSTADEPIVRNINPAKELSIRIISV